MNTSSILSVRKDRRASVRRTGRRRLDRARWISAAFLCFGVLCGAMLFLCFRSVFQTQLWDWFLIFQRSANGRTFFELFSGFAAQALLFWSVVALLGTSPMGTGLICAAVFLKSAGAGALGAFFLQSFGMTGVGYFFLAIFPGKIPFFAALFLLFETANQTCARIRSALKGEGALAPDAVRRFAVRLSVSGALFLIGALTDCLTVTLFSGLFSLSFSAY